MILRILFLTFLWVVCLFSEAMVYAEVSGTEIALDRYTNGLDSKWQEKSFQGKTDYEVTREDGRLCIQAKSRASASGLYYEIEYSVKEYPILGWQWKIESILSKGDAHYQEGDDYAARVYVIFPSWLFWRTKAINYIWANKLPKGKVVPNAFTSNAVMIAVESGSEMAGQWVTEKRDVFEDYRRHFGEDPPRVGAIAIMTDTDNTGGSATAWYGVIRIRPREEGKRGTE